MTNEAGAKRLTVVRGGRHAHRFESRTRGPAGPTKRRPRESGASQEEDMGVSPPYAAASAGSGDASHSVCQIVNNAGRT